MNIRVVATSSRSWDSKNQDHQMRIRDGLMTLRLLVSAQFDVLAADEITIVHGAARGGDRMIDTTARELGMLTEPHPISEEEWGSLGNFAGPRRNRAMLDDPRGCDFVIGFRIGGIQSIGTTDCIKAAWERLIPTVVFDYPIGYELRRRPHEPRQG